MDADRTKMPSREDSMWLDILLDLRRSPVGIRFLVTEEQYKASPFPEVEVAIPYCRIVRNAGGGRERKFSLDGLTCSGAAKALGFISVDNDAASGNRHRRMGIYSNLGVSRTITSGMTYCGFEPHGIEVAPLSAFTEDDPDVVIVITTPYNAMRLLQGYAYHHGHHKTVKMTGMQGVCEELTSLPFETNELNVSMLCSGTRFVSLWEKDEMGVGIPFGMLASVIDGLKQTATHMEADPEKTRVDAQLNAYGVSGEVEIVYGKTYCTGGFRPLSR